MYAIIKTGGKQYKVAEGDVLNVEKLDAEKGAEVVFDEVLAIVNDGEVTVGKPFMAKAKRFWFSNTEPKSTIANALAIVSRTLLLKSAVSRDKQHGRFPA